MFFVVSKRKIATVLAVLLCVGAVVTGITVPAVLAADSPRTGFTVVIDAGHGGIDGGVVGSVSGTPEAGINLAIAKSLEENFSKAGVRVVMTRTGTAGLYAIDSKTPKKDDMKARAKIIRGAKPDLMISVHCNSFPLKAQRGAQVFYRAGSEPSIAAADRLQSLLNRKLPASTRLPQAGDYYVLNCYDTASVLVECGFLSNAEDEKNLLDAEYQKQLAYVIFVGGMSVLGKGIAEQG